MYTVWTRAKVVMFLAKTGRELWTDYFYKANHYYPIKCSCGKIYYTNLSDVLRGGSLKKNGKKRSPHETCGDCKPVYNRYSFNELDVFIKKAGASWKEKYDPLTSSDILDLYCSCGKEWHPYIGNLIKGHYHCADSSHYPRGEEHANYIDYGNLSGTDWITIQSSANRKGANWPIEFDAWFVSEVYDKQNRQCAEAWNLPIYFEKETGHRTASPDRIDSSIKKYTKDNFQLVHTLINKMKWDHSQERFHDICNKVSYKTMAREWNEDLINKYFDLAIEMRTKND